MKSSLFIILLIFSLQTVVAQVITEETKKTVEKTAGDTIYTKSIIISQSEDITPRNQMIVINPLKFFLFYNLSYFHSLSENVGVGLGFQAPTISGVSGFGLNAEMRIYPSGKTLRGFYIAPNVSYNTLKSSGISTSPFSIGALVGWQWFPGDEFAMGLGIGIDYYSGSISNGNSDFDNYDGTAPALRFDIGYAW